MSNIWDYIRAYTTCLPEWKLRANAHFLQIHGRHSMPDPAASYTMHYCERHRVEDQPACCLTQRIREVE